MAKIIILNAPAGAGKDTIADMFAFMTKCKTVSLKTPMFDIARSILGASNFGKFIFAYNDRTTKEKPMSILGGKSPREFMIWISETVIKPTFGKSYFGERLAVDVENMDVPTVICSDGGFSDEIIPLITRGHEVIICRLHRNGFTFEGDSRNYIHLDESWHGVLGYRELDFVLVNGDPMHTVNQIFEATK